MHILIFILETYNQNNDVLPWDTIYQQSQYSHRSRGRFICYKLGLYPDIYDCRKYYECIKAGNNHQSKFHQLVHKCDYGKVFSYAYGTCTQPQNSERVECTNYNEWKKHDSSGNYCNLLLIHEIK